MAFSKSLLLQPLQGLNRRDGVVVRASASQLADLEFIFPCRSIPKDYIKVFTASLIGALPKRDSVENKLAILLVMCLGKTLNGMPQSSFDR